MRKIWSVVTSRQHPSLEVGCERQTIEESVANHSCHRFWKKHDGDLTRFGRQTQTDIGFLKKRKDEREGEQKINTDFKPRRVR
jgi:hypothetical protein